MNSDLSEWLINNIIDIAGILVGAFIGYHVYYLSKRVNLKDRLTHRDAIKNDVEPILGHIRQGKKSMKVELINVRKYLTHYPHNNERNRHGYTYLGSELKDITYNGIEFFTELKGSYKTQDGRLTFNPRLGLPAGPNVLIAGIVPYEWIEHVDERGDEFSYRSQFFVKFKGKDLDPYKYYRYYIKRDTFDKSNEPWGMQWRQVEIVY